jgi:FkbM family methyltransferase
MKPIAVLHVGAHLAEEEPEYRTFNWGHVTWVEAQTNLAQILIQKLDAEANTVIQAAVWHTSGEKLSLNLASNSYSTSLLNFGTHAMSYPEISFVGQIEVTTVTLDDALPHDYKPDFVNLDIQGVELDALKGFEPRLPHVKWIYCEAHLEETYLGCTLLPELDTYLEQHGFKRVYLTLAPTRTWGEAIYGRRDLYPISRLGIMKIRQIMKSRIIRPLVHLFFRINRKLKRF